MKLKLQYFGSLMQRNESLEKTLILGKFDCRKPRRRKRISKLDGINDLMYRSLSKLQELLIDREASREFRQVP